MRPKLFAFVWFFALGLAPVLVAAEQNGRTPMPAACAHKAEMTCCSAVADVPCEMPCCKGGTCEMPCHAESKPIATGIEVLLSIGAMDWSLPALDMPARQTAVVWFHRPVWVGENVLMGKYVIEHDTDRMARGEPCTHIYAADAMTTPVVAFHCTHIDSDRPDKDTVVLATSPDGTRKLLYFQFAGEYGAHGYPNAR
jgi:hypothetical protein